jgi:hypothetical protein
MTARLFVGIEVHGSERPNGCVTSQDKTEGEDRGFGGISASLRGTPKCPPCAEMDRASGVYKPLNAQSVERMSVSGGKV